MENQKENIPNQWNCPITYQLMADPVITDDGFSYQREPIANWFKTSNKSPNTGLILSTTKLIPNRALKQTINHFIEKMKIQGQQNKKQKDLKQQIARLEEKLDCVNQVMAEQTDQLFSLTKLIRKVERQFVQTRELIDQNKVEIEELNQTLARKTKYLSSLKKQIAQTEQKCICTKKRLEEMREKEVEIDKINQTLAKKADQLLSLAKIINQAEQKLFLTTKSFEEMREKEVEIDKINQTLAQKTSHLQKLVQQIINIEQKLAQNQKRLLNTNKNQVKIYIEKHPIYVNFINNQNQDKMWLEMVDQNVTDQIVEEIAQCNLIKIQILSLGWNQITDIGFNLIFENREWPVLQDIFLDLNKIQNIHSLHKIPNLKKLDIYHNELSEESCIYMIENQWPNMKELGISFNKGFNDNCWKKLLKVMFRKFPNLEYLEYYQKGDISSETQERIENYCKDLYIVLSACY